MFYSAANVQQISQFVAISAPQIVKKSQKLHLQPLILVYKVEKHYLCPIFYKF